MTTHPVGMLKGRFLYEEADMGEVFYNFRILILVL
jgi:hypothetical protein